MRQPRKKSFYCIIILILCLTLTGCSIGRSIDTSTPYVSEFKDGSFVVSSMFADSYGYFKSIRIGVHQGIITEVSYTEKNKEGVFREDLPILNQRWADCDLSYPQIISQLYTETIISQGKRIDAVSGATKTVNDYLELLDQALANAKAGQPAEQVINSFNDIYTVISPVDPVTGSQEEMTVSIANGNVNSVQVHEITNNAAFYSIGKAYNSLAEMSTRLKSLEDVSAPTIDPQIVARYNSLLAQVRAIRE